MEKFYFELPSIVRKEEALGYIKEFNDYKSEINGVGGLNKYVENYEGWLEYLERMKTKAGASLKGYVPGVTYFLVRESDNRIIGMLNLRLELNDSLRRHGGHIGYSIRPTERRKGYNKINLYLGLIKANEYGIDNVMLSCDVNNLGSDKTIKALGGVLERKEKVDNKVFNIYWIDVNKSLEKNRARYSGCLVKERVR